MRRFCWLPELLQPLKTLLMSMWSPHGPWDNVLCWSLQGTLVPHPLLAASHLEPSLTRFRLVKSPVRVKICSSALLWEKDVVLKTLTFCKLSTGRPLYTSIYFYEYPIDVELAQFFSASMLWMPVDKQERLTIAHMHHGWMMNQMCRYELVAVVVLHTQNLL